MSASTWILHVIDDTVCPDVGFRVIMGSNTGVKLKAKWILLRTGVWIQVQVSGTAGKHCEDDWCSSNRAYRAMTMKAKPVWDSLVCGGLPVCGPSCSQVSARAGKLLVQTLKASQDKSEASQVKRCLFTWFSFLILFAFVSMFTPVFHTFNKRVWTRVLSLGSSLCCRSLKMFSRRKTSFSLGKSQSTAL